MSAPRDHSCDSGNFDRAICPEPCGMMHSYCTTCGERADKCAHEGSTREPVSRYALRVRADASGYYAHARGEVYLEGANLTHEQAQEICRAMPNGGEFEVVEVGA